MMNMRKIFIEQIKAKTDCFKDKFSFEKRLVESTRIMEKYPDRVPIICEKSGNSPDIPDIDKNKYLKIPNNIQYILVISHH